MAENGISKRRYGTIFNDVAADYDRLRLTYPEKLIDLACTGLGRGTQVLELGCGTGQLTRGLLERGLKVTAVEPGENLVALAKQNLGDFGDQVKFVNARFEDAQLARGHFQAIFSASAFHWLDPAVSWRKTAESLPAGGTLALIQDIGILGVDDTEDALAAIARVSPKIASEWPRYKTLEEVHEGTERRSDDISDTWAWITDSDVRHDDAARLFEDVQLSSSPRILEHTAEQLNALFRTTSFFARLSPEQRQALEAENTKLYERLGRPIRSCVATVLLTARKRGLAR